MYPGSLIPIFSPKHAAYNELTWVFGTPCAKPFLFARYQLAQHTVLNGPQGPVISEKLRRLLRGYRHGY